MYFRRQHPYGIYILDFFCFEANLVIEVDGLDSLKSSSNMILKEQNTWNQED